MPDRIAMLRGLGLLEIREPRYNRTVLTLTPRGVRVAELLERVAEEIDRPS